MSATVSTLVQPAAPTLLGAAFRIVSAGWERIARYRDHRAAIATLREFDDRALRDIGLTRSEIEAAVRGLIVPYRGRT